MQSFCDPGGASCDQFDYAAASSNANGTADASQGGTETLMAANTPAPPPTTMEEIDAVAKPLIQSAEGALENGAVKGLNILGGVVLAPFVILSNPVELNSSEDKQLAKIKPLKSKPGKGVKSGKKDRSGPGREAQSRELGSYRKNMIKQQRESGRAGYVPTTNKSDDLVTQGLKGKSVEEILEDYEK